MGVDILDIRYIIYIDRPHTLLDYVQESRRVEQDRCQSKAIVIEESSKSRQEDKGQTEKERGLVEKYI